MIYKFKSKASGDVIMLGENGDQLLRLLGREPATQGIIEPGTMTAAIAALKVAVRAEEEQPVEDVEGKPRGISLRQRVWPMIDMMERSKAADEPITWGT